MIKNNIKALVITLVLASFFTFAQSKESYAEESNVTYTLENGTLTIRGKGDMPEKMIFRCNKNIKEVIIEKGITSISDYAFEGCSNLKKADIAKTVKSIGESSFESTKIKEIVIPNSVNKIGSDAFSYCDYLKKVTMPGDFIFYNTNINEGGKNSYGTLGYEVYLDTLTFTSPLKIENTGYIETKNYKVWKKDPKYKSIKGVIYSKNGKNIVRVPSLRKELVIEKGCKTFCLQSVLYAGWVDEDDTYYYFNGCCELKKITIPKSVKYIDNSKYKGINSNYNLNVKEIICESKKLSGKDVCKLNSLSTGNAHITIDYRNNFKYCRPILKGKYNKKAKTLKLNWSKIKGAKGYQIKLCSNKKFKKNVKVYYAGKKDSSKKIKIKKSKVSYARIRAYKKINGKKVYGKWTTIKL